MVNRQLWLIDSWISHSYSHLEKSWNTVDPTIRKPRMGGMGVDPERSQPEVTGQSQQAIGQASGPLGGGASATAWTGVSGAGD